jgi:probable HAF family extracellular repeat protein
MACAARSNVRRHLRLVVAGAVVLTALTAATARASVPPVEAPAAGPTRPVSSTSPRVAARPAPGFLLERGRFKPVAIPRGLEDLAPQGIAPIDINDRGQIVGAYPDTAGAAHGFRLDRGRFTRIDVPGAKGTQPQGSNNRGQIVGVYSNTRSDISANDVQDRRGFLLDRGRYVRLDFPGALSSQAFDINDRGQVVGEYRDAAGTFHGYVWERGRFRSIEVGTAATGINNRGQITGPTGDPTVATDGFLLERGRVTTFKVPGAQGTFPFGIDDRGQIVGLSVLTATTGSGFLRDARGRFTAINRPGAAVTAPFDINNRGQIVGVAPIADATPSPQRTSTPPTGGMPRVLTRP